MTTPEQQPRRVAVGHLSIGLLLIIAAVVMFVLAAFAAGGDEINGIPAWSWGFGAAAAIALSWVVP